MRVLLISANMEKLPDPVAPIGLAYLTSALKAGGHEVHGLDLCFEKDVEEALQKAISFFSPEAVGVSLRNIDNVSYPDTVSYLPFYKKVMERIRQLSPAPIFLGGSGFTLMPKEILAHLEADGGIVGEGEEAFPKALAAVASNLTISSKGFSNSRSAERATRPACIQDLDSLPPPDWDSLNLKKYFTHGGMGNLQTKRGCPFECIYCTYPLIEGREVRLRSPEKVVGDAQALLSQGVENAFVVDNIFNFPEDHAQAVCQVLIAKKVFLKWSCYAHPAYFTPSLAEIMQKAGCTGVEFGTDSGSPSVLGKLRKKFTPEDLRRSTRLAREANLEVCHSLSLGSPGETEETLQETLALMEEISPTAVIAMVGLRIFPGTVLARLAKEEGLIPPGYDYLAPTFYISPGLKEKIMAFARKTAAAHPNWIFPGLGINVSPRLQGKLRRIGVKGPLWEHMKIIRERRAGKKESHV